MLKHMVKKKEKPFPFVQIRLSCFMSPRRHLLPSYIP